MFKRLKNLGPNGLTWFYSKVKITNLPENNSINSTSLLTSIYEFIKINTSVYGWFWEENSLFVLNGIPLVSDNYDLAELRFTDPSYQSIGREQTYSYKIYYTAAGNDPYHYITNLVFFGTNLSNISDIIEPIVLTIEIDQHYINTTTWIHESDNYEYIELNRGTTLIEDITISSNRYFKSKF